MFKKPDTKPEFKKISDTIWEIPKEYKKGMLVPARIYATKNLLDNMDLGVFEQITNVAMMPGIVDYAVCHADGHQGYGMPIGGVAAFDLENGVISPGSVGFDKNCGMRLLSTNLTMKEVEPKIKELTNTLFEMVPAGVGNKGFVKLNKNQFLDVVQEGAKWCVEQGYGWKEDLGKIEDFGTFKEANPDYVSDKAIQRGLNQLGTLGSGNHYLEVQVVKVENILDTEIAKKLGIFTKDQVVIMLHCGSRGFGHGVATDYLKKFDEAMKKYNIKLPDRELACAPINSKEGKEYYGAMACAANMAYANRQVITHQVREAFKRVFKEEPKKLGIKLIQDNTHNLARIQKLRTKDGWKEYLVHLKGATRALGPGHPDLNPFYQEIGSGICIGGSMETGSYFLTGTRKAEEETFGTTAHGSGRTMSRTQARKEVRGEQLQKKMENEGIYVKAVSMSGLAEEGGQAYKNVDDVIDSLKKSGISHPVLKLIPRSNVKG